MGFDAFFFGRLDY
jgi:lysosomal alpha-mannosidase